MWNMSHMLLVELFFSSILFKIIWVFLVIKKEYIHDLLVRYFLMQIKKQHRVEKRF